MINSAPQSPVSLRPAEPGDQRLVFNWLVNAYQGPFFCTEEAPPTWEEFCSDYNDLFFDGSAPKKGRVYIITQGREDIGAVSYDARLHNSGEADIDIWLAREELCGQGRGSSALFLLSDILKKSLGFKRLLISPCGNNTRAVRAYEKTGFNKLDLPRKEMQTRYGPLDCSHAQVMTRGL